MLLALTIDFAALPAYAWHIALWVLGVFLLWLWLHKELTPKRFLSIWETDGTLSSRQILAWVTALYGMAMRAAMVTDAAGKVTPRLDNDGLDVCLQASFILFGIGGFVKAAEKIKPTPNVTVKKVDEMNVGSTPNAPGAPVE